MTDIQLARFSNVHSQGERLAAEMGVPLGAYQKMTAEELFLVMSSPALGGPFATDPGISVDQGLIAAIVKCSPGQGPYLHAHYKTLESFICLQGQFHINWGDEGEHEALLDTFDTIAVPRGVVRSFTSASKEGDAYILAFIRGDTPEDFADVAMTTAAAEDLDTSFGSGTAEKIKEIGWRFDAGIETPNVQVSPAEMETHIARFADLEPTSRNGVERFAVMYPDSTRAAISGDPGELAQIFRLSKDGAISPYARTRTKETLMCLTGNVTLQLGDDAGEQHELEPWDAVSMAPGVARSCRNAGETPAMLLSLVIGNEDEVFDDVSEV